MTMTPPTASYSTGPTGLSGQRETGPNAWPQLTNGRRKLGDNTSWASARTERNKGSCSSKQASSKIPRRNISGTKPGVVTRKSWPRALTTASVTRIYLSASLRWGVRPIQQELAQPPIPIEDKPLRHNGHSGHRDKELTVAVPIVLLKNNHTSSPNVLSNMAKCGKDNHSSKFQQENLAEDINDGHSDTDLFIRIPEDTRKANS